MHDPWFVRSGAGWLTSIRPVSLLGWLTTLAYALSVTALAWSARATAPRFWPVWAIVILAATLIFVVTAWRLSVPAGSR